MAARYRVELNWGSWQVLDYGAIVAWSCEKRFEHEAQMASVVWSSLDHGTHTDLPVSVRH